MHLGWNNEGHLGLKIWRYVFVYGFVWPSFEGAIIENNLEFTVSKIVVDINSPKTCMYYEINSE